MQSRENAIAQIEKLLKLSKSPYQAEAEIALQKARKLMLQYHIDELSLNHEEKENVECEAIEVDECMIFIYALIARQNRCDAYHGYGYRDGRRRHFVNVVGFKFDIECVRVMGAYATDCVKIGVKKLREAIRSGNYIDVEGTMVPLEYTSSTKGLKDFYIRGFQTGLKMAFDKQNAESEFHLMVITPPEVKEEMEKKNLKGNYHGQNRSKTEINHNNIVAYKCGLSSGSNVGQRKKLEEGCGN